MLFCGHYRSSSCLKPSAVVTGGGLVVVRSLHICLQCLKLFMVFVASFANYKVSWGLPCCIDINGSIPSGFNELALSYACFYLKMVCFYSVTSD